MLFQTLHNNLYSFIFLPWHPRVDLERTEEGVSEMKGSQWVWEVPLLPPSQQLLFQMEQTSLTSLIPEARMSPNDNSTRLPGHFGAKSQKKVFANKTLCYPKWPCPDMLPKCIMKPFGGIETNGCSPHVFLGCVCALDIVLPIKWWKCISSSL